MPQNAQRTDLPSFPIARVIPSRYVVHDEHVLTAGPAIIISSAIANVSNFNSVAWRDGVGGPGGPPFLAASAAMTCAGTWLIYSMFLDRAFDVVVQVRNEPDTVIVPFAPWFSDLGVAANTLSFSEGRRVPAESARITVTQTGAGIGTGWFYMALESP